MYKHVGETECYTCHKFIKSFRTIEVAVFLVFIARAAEQGGLGGL